MDNQPFAETELILRLFEQLFITSLLLPAVFLIIVVVFLFIMNREHNKLITAIDKHTINTNAILKDIFIVHNDLTKQIQLLIEYYSNDNEKEDLDGDNVQFLIEDSKDRE